MIFCGCSGLPWSDHSETESGDQADDTDGSCIYRTAKKAKRRHSARSRAKKYKVSLHASNYDTRHVKITNTWDGER